MVKMVTIFGIVFFVSCALSLIQGQSPKHEEDRRSIVPHHAHEAVRESDGMPYAATREMLEPQIDYTQFIG